MRSTSSSSVARASRARLRALGAAGLLACLTLTACGEEAPLRPAPITTTPPPTVPAYDPDADRPAGSAALALVPADATLITVTDFDESRTQLGVPDLTSEDLMADREDYWRRAARETVLLTEGRLREDNSTLMLDHGFTQDDVDWEARWTTPSGPGWVLGFRPDLDMARVQQAVEAGVPALAGATVDPALHLAGVGMVTGSAPAWGDREDVDGLTNDVSAEGTLYRSSCVPFDEALGPDAGAEDQQAVLATHDVTDLEPLDAFGLSFVDGFATARLGLARGDLLDRNDLTRSWPDIGTPAFSDGFAEAVVDPATGRIGLAVTDPQTAAALALTGTLPFAVCNEVTPMAEPTGL